MRPKILLYADSYNGRVGTSDTYADFFSKFGEIILISPMNDLEFFIEHGDILAIPGGADVDPMRYGEHPQFLTGRSNTHYEYLDKFLLGPWIETGKPIIGICRGAQTLNVALGGNLIQHINGHVGGEHRDKQEDIIYTNLELWPFHAVNSYHHQAIGELGNGLDVIGWGTIYKGCPSIKKDYRKLLLRKKYHKIPFDALSPERKKEVLKHFKNGRPKSVWGWSEENYYAVPEIIKHVEKPYIAFQYHPEEFNCDLATELIGNMLLDFFGEEFNDNQENTITNEDNQESNPVKAETYIISPSKRDNTDGYSTSIDLPSNGKITA
jgi:anthranilate/para-aminobenzoate synthase component II